MIHFLHLYYYIFIHKISISGEFYYRMYFEGIDYLEVIKKPIDNSFLIKHYFCLSGGFKTKFFVLNVYFKINNYFIQILVYILRISLKKIILKSHMKS